MHIFAYPWKPYSTKHMSSDPLMAPGIGYSGGAPKYQGGPLGIKAILDAANPWDIIKALARGFRWMFVGARYRHQDVSYQPPKLSADDTSYGGPTYASTGEQATELRDSHDKRRRSDTVGDGSYGSYDDRSGLLSSSQAFGRVPSSSPYRTTYQDVIEHAGAAIPQPPRAASPTRTHGYAGSIDLKDQVDTGYHPGMGPPPESNIVTGPSGSVHPAQRGQAIQGGPGGWNLWGGVQSNSSSSLGRGGDDAESVGRPPTYRTNDPYG